MSQYAMAQPSAGRSLPQRRSAIRVRIMCALRRLRPEQRFARKARAVRRRPLRQNGKFAAGCSLPSCRRRRTLSCRALVRRAEASARGGPQFWRMRALRRLRPEQRFARKGHAVGRLEYADLSKSIPRGIGGPNPKMPAAGEGVATVRNMRSMRAPILRKGARILREGMQSFIGRTQLKKRVCK